ncbi:hypothetical protein D3C73_1102300 [compost metagenome]
MAAGAHIDCAVRALGDGADWRGDLPDVPAFANHGPDAVRAGRHRCMANAGARGALGAGARAGLVGGGLHHQRAVGGTFQHAAGPGLACWADCRRCGGHCTDRQGRHRGGFRHPGRARQAGAPGRAHRSPGCAVGYRADTDLAAAALRTSAAGGAMVGFRVHGVGIAARRASPD